ncbi:response regulator transcription factor [Pedobacter sp. HDW13]|uniref:response regulator transcription factor n=1 Tax=Pedobacter sp. HDW13 TaxID=2714940 RepID=UPI00140C7AC3|nr:response regulator transcription factor [Pedobacter sp. HDW13]QIL38917.1 response regulator transcription factor [Pedobacter sp. HDW13]
MFKKVLIAEDHEIVNLSLRNALADLNITITNQDYVFYCDDALTRIQKALNEGNPYELIITDLSFDEESPKQKIADGRALIKAVRGIQPDLKVLVFSIENRALIASSLFKELNIDAFVPKARHDAKDLKLAIESIYKNKKYHSPNLRQKQANAHIFTEYDKTIVSLLLEGRTQKEMPDLLKQKKLEPSGLSSIEKRINLIKTTLNISNNGQLIAHCIANKII